MEKRHQDDDHGEEERSGVGGSRWNPTKEQIEMLEKVYSSEGVRTPSAEQIQQITARLRVYGHIEGKNVFYWFQNHKARQRQKQRNDRCLLANHNVNHIAPRFLPPSPHYHYHPNHPGINLNTRPHPTYLHHYLPNQNVICNQYCHLPQTNLGFYNPPQHHYSAPAAADHDHHHQSMKKRSSKPKVGVPPGSTLSRYTAAMKQSKSVDDQNQGNFKEMTTLNLFPVHPTGILEHKLGGSNNGTNNNSAANSYATSSSSDTNMNYAFLS